MKTTAVSIVKYVLVAMKLCTNTKHETMLASGGCVNHVN